MKELFIKYYPELVYYATKILDDENKARDVAIDCIMNVHKKGYDEKVVRHLLYLSVKNKCWDIKKYNKRHKVIEFNYSNIENAIIEYDVIQSFKELHSAIKRLKPIHRQVLDLHFFKGKTFIEIGEILNKNVSTVRSIKLTALKKLRENKHISNFYLE